MGTVMEPIPTRSAFHELILMAVGGAAVVAAFALAPTLAEPAAFKSLVDDRELLGVPNFWNVVSNVPLLLVGAWGARWASRPGAGFVEAVEKRAWITLFAAVALTGIGSSYYHLSPDADRLMWDRLPMAIGFMALLSAVIAERVRVVAGAKALVPLVVAGAASVLYWRWSLLRGTENILPYALVQYGGLVAMLLLSSFFRSRYSRGGDYFAAIGVYGLAKVAELLDERIYEWGGFISGHSLKHLVAALGIWWLLRMIQRRRPHRNNQQGRST